MVSSAPRSLTPDFLIKKATNENTTTFVSVMKAEIRSANAA
jgi:hypothetical protein